MTPLDTFLACACVLLVAAFALTLRAFKAALRSANRFAKVETELKNHWFERFVEQKARLRQLNARLAPFIAKRERNKDGTFKSSKAA